MEGICADPQVLADLFSIPDTEDGVHVSESSLETSSQQHATTTLSEFISSYTQQLDELYLHPAQQELKLFAQSNEISLQGPSKEQWGDTHEEEDVIHCLTKAHQVVDKVTGSLIQRLILPLYARYPSELWEEIALLSRQDRHDMLSKSKGEDPEFLFQDISQTALRLECMSSTFGYIRAIQQDMSLGEGNAAAIQSRISVSKKDPHNSPSLIESSWSSTELLDNIQEMESAIHVIRENIRLTTMTLG